MVGHATDGLREHAQQRSLHARASIEKALRQLGEQGAPINVNAVARAAGVSRKTIYNHPDLLDQVRRNATHRHAVPANRSDPADGGDGGENAILAALVDELASQKAHYQKEITDLKAALREQQHALVLAQRYIQRLTHGTAEGPSTDVGA